MTVVVITAQRVSPTWAHSTMAASCDRRRLCCEGTGGSPRPCPGSGPQPVGQSSAPKPPSPHHFQNTWPFKKKKPARTDPNTRFFFFTVTFTYFQNQEDSALTSVGATLTHAAWEPALLLTSLSTAARAPHRPPHGHHAAAAVTSPRRRGRRREQFQRRESRGFLKFDYANAPGLPGRCVALGTLAGLSAPEPARDSMLPAPEIAATRRGGRTRRPPQAEPRKHSPVGPAEGGGGQWAAPGSGPRWGGKIPHSLLGPGGTLPARLSSPGDKLLLRFTFRSNEPT